MLFLRGLGLWEKVKDSLFWELESDQMISLLLVHLSVKVFIFFFLTVKVPSIMKAE